MTPIPCVFYAPTTLIRRYLRRFIMSSSGKCPHDFGDSYERCCNACAFLDDFELVLTEEGYIPSYEWPRGDDRWPKVCEGCGRPFPQDRSFDSAVPWQVHIDRLYRGPDGVLVPLHELPVGAIWRQDFGHGPTSRYCAARNGFALETARMMELPHLFVRTPGGVWDMDTISTNGEGWDVTGEPPNVTANPSIQHNHGNRWHGWLRNGVLTEA